MCAGPVWAANYDAGMRALRRGDKVTALQEFLPLAEEGHPQSQNAVCYLYYGQGKFDDAAKWCQAAADHGFIAAMESVGWMYRHGKGVRQDYQQAIKWFEAMAEDDSAQHEIRAGSRAPHYIAEMYRNGEGVDANPARALEILRKSAESGNANSQFFVAYVLEYGDFWLAPLTSEALVAAAEGHYNPKSTYRQDWAAAATWYQKCAGIDSRCTFALGRLYEAGHGVSGNYAEAKRWYERAVALDHNGLAMNSLGSMYEKGEGVPQDFIQAHMWFNLEAGIMGSTNRDRLAKLMTPEQIARAQDLARDWTARHSNEAPENPDAAPKVDAAASSGSGFFVDRNGHLLTNYHVIDGCHSLRAEIGGESRTLSVVSFDRSNDLALLKSEGVATAAATFSENRSARLGQSIIAVGYPLRGLLASGAKITAGNVSALAGVADDTRMLQITAPVQPGNSGGPVLDESGNVIGVIVAKLDALKLAQATGDIPQNVNFAIKGVIAQSFLETNGVTYPTAPSTVKLDATAISDKASKFTVVVECWK